MTHLYDTHMHTPLCKHAKGEPSEYAQTALDRGLAGVVFTCHSPGPEGFAPKVRMGVEELTTYVEIVDRAKVEYHGRLDVRLGLESDYFPGHEDWLRDLHQRADFNYILGSVHPHYDEYKEAFFHNDVREFQRTYFRHLAEAAESGLFDCLAHPDLVKVVHPDHWQPNEIINDIRESLIRIRDTGIAMELNTSGLNKLPCEMHPGTLMLNMMKELEIPVVVGSDAHDPRRVAGKFLEALTTLKAIGFEKTLVFLDRKPCEISIDESLQRLKP